MSKIHCLLGFLQIVVGVAFLSSRLAFAQPKQGDEYTALLKRATAAEKKGRADEALDAFIPAYAMKQEYRVACSIARLAFRVQNRRLVEAAKYYEICKRSADRPKTGQGIERRAAEVVELEIAKAHIITLMVHADEGANIYANREFVGVAPLPFALFLDPGTSTIEARKDGEAITRSISGKRGDELSVELMKPAATSPAPAPAPAPALSPLPNTFTPAPNPAPARPRIEALKVSSGPWPLMKPFVIIGVVGLAIGNFAAGHYFENKAIEARKEEATNAAQWAILTKAGQQDRADEAAFTAVAAGARAGFYHNLKIVAFVGSGVAAAGALPLFFIAGSTSSRGLSLAGRF